MVVDLCLNCPSRSLHSSQAACHSSHFTLPSLQTLGTPALAMQTQRSRNAEPRSRLYRFWTCSTPLGLRPVRACRNCTAPKDQTSSASVPCAGHVMQYQCACPCLFQIYFPFHGRPTNHEFRTCTGKPAGLRT